MIARASSLFLVSSVLALFVACSSKFGETWNPKTRYTQEYLNDHNAELIEEVTGSKQEIRAWETKSILNYAEEFGERPPLNKTNH